MESLQKFWQESSERRGDTWPQGGHITWTFPGNELTESKELTIEWFDGEYYPPKEVRALYAVEDYPPESAMLIGTEGALLNPLGATPNGPDRPATSFAAVGVRQASGPISGFPCNCRSQRRRSKRPAWPGRG
jgi:hypothetical protein